MSMLSQLTRLAAIAACVGFTGAAFATEAKYKCSGGAQLTARFSPPGAANSHVILAFAGSGTRIVLPQAMSADGGRYADGGTEFWIKGRSASLTRDGKSETCMTK